jgi:hypothetical protein
MDTPFYLIAQAGFPLLTIIYLVLVILEFHKAIRLTGWDVRRKKNFITSAIVILLLWGGFVSAWSISGKMADFSNFPFNLMPVILIPIVIAVPFIASKRTGELLKRIPPANLIRLQSFRFFVEILLWLLFVANMLPVQMTFEGRNFDILAGFTAPVIAVLALKRQISKSGIIVWNVICLALLLNIVITAILSTPSPWRVFMNEPANYIVTWFPFSFLPGFLVPLAYYLHFLSLRQMAQR